MQLVIVKVAFRYTCSKLHNRDIRGGGDASPVDSKSNSLSVIHKGVISAGFRHELLSHPLRCGLKGHAEQEPLFWFASTRSRKAAHGRLKRSVNDVDVN